MAEKLERPCSSRAHTSPSSTAAGVFSAFGSSFATLPKRPVRSLPFRLVSVASPPETRPTARKPSHFTSKTQPSLVGSSAASVASIGRYSARFAGFDVPSSRLRMMSQFFGSPLSFAGTSAQVPSSRSPCSRTVSPPSFFSSTSSYVPLSQISTVPAPYCPFGISPSKPAYSSGWSSTWTARCCCPGSSGTPFGTAQLASAPARSRRKS